MLVLEWVGSVLLGIGSFLVLTGALGVVRMPDFYTRLHPAGKADSAGQLCVLTGFLCHSDDLFVAIKLGLLGLFVLVTAPTATHAITKAAHLDGLAPTSEQHPPRSDDA